MAGPVRRVGARRSPAARSARSRSSTRESASAGAASRRAKIEHSRAHGGGLAGYVELTGRPTSSRPSARTSRSLRLVVDAQPIVEYVGITAGFADTGVAPQIEMFRVDVDPALFPALIRVGRPAARRSQHPVGAGDRSEAAPIAWLRDWGRRAYALGRVRNRSWQRVPLARSRRPDSNRRPLHYERLQGPRRGGRRGHGQA
jgi:hypothetical protein